MTNSVKTYKGLILSFIAFIVNYGVNFIIAPYVSVHLPGTYGYVKIANDIISYAQLITIALDSMASRFISISYNRGDIEKAYNYYCSIMLANIYIAAALTIPFIIIVTKLDTLLTVPVEYIYDVKLLFFFSFLSFLITIAFSVNSVAPFVVNRLDLSYIVEIVAYFLRASLLVALFSLLIPHVYYIGVVSAIVSIITIIGNQKIKCKVLQSFRFKFAVGKLKLAWEVMLAGIWNSVQKLGQILLDGLDLIIANIFIGSAAMNDLSFAKTMPAIIAALLVKVSTAFVPNYTILYATDKLLELKNAVKSSMTILSVIVSIPVGIIMAFGTDFYRLWIPNENIAVISLLSTLSCILYIVSTPMNAVYSLFTVANKVRLLALVTLISGTISTLSVFLLLRLTNLEVLAIVCCSVVIGIIRNIFVVSPYAASLLGFPKWTFIPEILKSIISVSIVFIISYIFRLFFPISGWLSFFIACIISGGLGLLINIMLLLDRERRRNILKIMHRGVISGKNRVE